MRRALALLAALALATPARAQAPFDYYLLSLSVEPSFCAASSRNAAKPECRTLTADGFRQTPLTLHGLWPNRARVSANRQPMDCPGPPFDVSADVAAGLDRYMPGGLGLARYEWRKHGTCAGLPPDRYFGDALALTRAANAAIGPALLADGGTVRVDDLRRSVATIDPALASALVVDCRFARGGGGALVEEIRLTFDRDLHPIPASSVGLGQNSGCPSGQGRIPLPG